MSLPDGFHAVIFQVAMQQSYRLRSQRHSVEACRKRTVPQVICTILMPFCCSAQRTRHVQRTIRVIKGQMNWFSCELSSATRRGERTRSASITNAAPPTQHTSTRSHPQEFVSERCGGNSACLEEHSTIDFRESFYNRQIGCVL